MNVLLFNAGSSSLKFSVLRSPDGSTIAEGAADWAGERTRYQIFHADQTTDEVVGWRGPVDAVGRCLADLKRMTPNLFNGPQALAAVGHRIVHGGDFHRATPLTSGVRGKLDDLCDLAPLHNQPSLDVIDAAQKALPSVPHVACYDTAFHQKMRPEARHYAIPAEWVNTYGIRRYGFHGLSHAYCSFRARELLAATGHPSRRLIICHLGHGCSATAVLNGECVDTTMGFTPLEGLMMATRSGSVDPGAILHLMQAHGLSAAEVSRQLNEDSGLLGMSGVSSDMRRVLQAAETGDERAQLAVATYCHRVRQAIGALAATLGGVDGLVFTAGVGENSAVVRSKVCDGLDCLGLHLDASRNIECRADADVAAVDCSGRIMMLHTREDQSMLRMTIAATSGDQCSSDQNHQP